MAGLAYTKGDYVTHIARGNTIVFGVKKEFNNASAVSAGQGKNTRRFQGELNFARRLVGREVPTEKATSSPQSPCSLFPDERYSGGVLEKACFSKGFPLRYHSVSPSSKKGHGKIKKKGTFSARRHAKRAL